MPPPPGIGGGGESSAFSTTTASVVSSRPAIDAAFCNAVRTTFVGSPVGADDLIVSVQSRAHTHGYSFLTDVAMHDTVDGAGPIVI